MPTVTPFSSPEQQSERKVLYSETIPVQDFQADNRSLLESIERLEQENRIIAQNLSKLQEESSLLRELFNHASKELNSMRQPALLVAEIVQYQEGNKAIIKLPNGNRFYCSIAQQVKELKSGDAVLVDQRTLNVVEKVSVATSLDVDRFLTPERPQEQWAMVGGLPQQVKELKEVIELPLKKPQLFEKVGIQPPKGVLLYGPPGTGKTLLAKAVANSTAAAFIEIVGSELVQKFIGEGARLVKDIFTFAKRKAPSIIFIDEVDAIAAGRMESGTSGEREVNRTFMQLLAEIDGFDNLGDVKVIAATNRIDILDQALLRPGRLDRLIEVGLPDEEGRLEILKIHTKNMNLRKVKLKDLAAEMEHFSGADIKAVCTEAGYCAIRDNREQVTIDDFRQGIEKVRCECAEEEGEGLFG